MDDRSLELALHYQTDVIDNLHRAKESMLKLSRKAGGMEEIPKTRMRLFARAIESAGQVAKDYSV